MKLNVVDKFFNPWNVSASRRTSRSISIAKKKCYYKYLKFIIESSLDFGVNKLHKRVTNFSTSTVAVADFAT